MIIFLSECAGSVLGIYFINSVKYLFLWCTINNLLAGTNPHKQLLTVISLHLLVGKVLLGLTRVRNNTRWIQLPRRGSHPLKIAKSWPFWKTGNRIKEEHKNSLGTSNSEFPLEFLNFRQNSWQTVVSWPQNFELDSWTWSPTSQCPPGQRMPLVPSYNLTEPNAERPSVRASFWRSTLRPSSSPSGSPSGRPLSRGTCSSTGWRHDPQSHLRPLRPDPDLRGHPVGFRRLVLIQRRPARQG